MYITMDSFLIFFLQDCPTDTIFFFSKIGVQFRKIPKNLTPQAMPQI